MDKAWCRLWAEEVSQRLSTFETRDMTNVIWAFATVHWRDERFLGRFCKARHEGLLVVLVGHKVTGDWVVWNMSSFTMSETVEEVEIKAECYSPQDIGNTLWALATLSWRSDAALAAISKRCFETAVSFDQQNLSISLWSYATLGYKTMCLVHKFSSALVGASFRVCRQMIAQMLPMPGICFII